MFKPRIYADFHNLDGSNQLRLTCAGTKEDLVRQCIALHEGLIATFYMDDADDRGEPDELRTEGVVHYDERESIWVASVDWSAVRHASDEQGPSRSDGTANSDSGPISQNGPTEHHDGSLSAAEESRRQA
jgi:hypothetical protein